MSDIKREYYHGVVRIGEGENAFTFTDVTSKQFEDICYRLRYAKNSITQSDMYYAASAMEALSHLLCQHEWLGRGQSRSYFGLLMDAVDNRPDEVPK